MNEPRSLSQQPPASPDTGGACPPAVVQVAEPIRSDGVPSVSRLFARMFGAAAANAHKATFAQTQWQETEWQDTRGQPPRL